jgi:MYXO-CTERM domain-containing protein
VGAGSCQLQASQAGNAQFEAASAVSATVQIALPAPAQATPVPTLQSWALLLLILGVLAVSQRRYQ